MNRKIFQPEQLNMARIIGVIILLALPLMGTSCPPQPTTPKIEVTELPDVTVYPNGTTGPSTAYTVGDNHRFRVEVKVEFLTPNANLDPPDTGVSLIWINPQNGREEFARANLKPGTTDTYMYILPGSNLLDICEPYFYRWSIVYDLVNSGRGVYLGEAKHAMGTKKRTSSNSIQQAMCAAPTSPWGSL